MKIGYYAAKALIMLAGLAVSIGLLMSILPAATGGIVVDEDDFNIIIGTSGDGMSVDISMDIGISSTMPYDIGLEYGVIVGDESRPIASDHKSITIAKGQTERITVDMTVPVISVAAHIMNKGFGDGDEPVTVPITVIIKGDYLEKIIKFDVKAIVETEVPVAPASVIIDDIGNTIEAKMEMDTDLDDLVRDAIEALSGESISIGDKVELTLNYANGEITALIESDDNILDIITTLKDSTVDGKLTIYIGADDYELNEDQTEMLIDTIDMIMNWEGGA